jgi:hypothetical protein
MLAVAELAVGTLAASAPVYRPLLRRAGVQMKGDTSATNTSDSNPMSRFSRKSRVDATGEPPVVKTGQHDKSIKVTDEFQLSTYRNMRGTWRQLSDTSDGDTDRLFPGARPRGDETSP